MADETEMSGTAEAVKAEPPAFMVMSAMGAVRKHLTRKQKSSSFFQEAPHVAGKTLRRGLKVLLTETQMKANELKLKRLFDSHSIEIYSLKGEKPVNIREEMEKAHAAAKADSADAPSMETAPVNPPAVIVPEPPPATTEVVPTPVEAFPVDASGQTTEVVQGEEAADKVEGSETTASETTASHKRKRR